MALSEGDKAVCMEIARTIVAEVLATHVATCPHGKFLETWKQRIIGIGVLAALIAAGSSAGMALMAW